MGWESFDVVRFDFGSLLQGQTGKTKLKIAYNSLIIGPRVLQCETNLKEIKGWESFDVARFDRGPLFQGQTIVQTLVSCLSGGHKFASVLRCVGLVFTPQPLRAVGVLFSSMVSGWVGGRRKKFVRAVSQKP